MQQRKTTPLVTLTAALFFSACVTHPPAPTSPVAAAPTPAPVVKRTNSWKLENASGPASIIVDLSDQRAYFYKGDHLVGETSISTGKKGFETPVGEYAVTQKDKEHVSNLYGDFVGEGGDVIKKNVDLSKEKPPEGATFVGAKMPYYLRFTGGYGLHAGRLPGYRASHGCVRMPREMAQNFFEHSEVGTPVRVRD